MPFTLSHPAAVLPLARGPLVPAALVAGSMAPDVPYFVDVPVSAQSWYEPFLNATETHSFPGVFLLGLPLTVALVVAYWLVRRPVMELLPPRMGAARAPGGAGRRRMSPRYVAWFLVSAVIGVTTHVLWDSFTHWDGYVVERVAFFRAQVTDSLTVARLLQHISTLAGGVVVIGRLWRESRRRASRPAVTPAVNSLGARVRWGVLGVILTVTVAGVALRLSDEEGLEPESALAVSATAGGAVFAAAVVLYAVCWHLARVVKPPMRLSTKLLGRRSGNRGGSAADAERPQPRSICR